MEKIQDLAYQLHDMLLESEEFIKLKDAEAAMLNDNNSKLLIDNYHSLLEKYIFDKSENVLKMLSKAKLKMDQNELVINYKKAYKEYQLLIGNITDLVFDGFKSQTLLDKIIRAK